MNHADFDRLVEYVVEERIKGVMCVKSAEYARGDDKLHNFKRAAWVSGKNPLVCLQGMKLKHDVSILDMLDDEEGTLDKYTREKWEEKISDDINYLILMLALLYEKYDWDLPQPITETKPGYRGNAVKKDCTTCTYTERSLELPPCNECFPTNGFKNWTPGV